MLGTNYHHHMQSDQSERVIRHINIESNQIFCDVLVADDDSEKFNFRKGPLEYLYSHLCLAINQIKLNKPELNLIQIC